MNAEQKQRAIKLIAGWRAVFWRDAGNDMAALLQELIDAPEPAPVGYTNETELDYVRTYEALPVSGAFWPTSDEDACVALYTALPAPESEPLTDSFVQMVPDKCDRIVWRGHYYHLKEGTEKPAPSVPDTDLARDAERWLSQRDLELLVTFGMQADDCDADGHTLSKEQTRRLCELGVLRNVGFGRSEMTSFGCVLFDQHWEQSRSLPLRTHAEYAAIAAKKGGAA